MKKLLQFIALNLYFATNLVAQDDEFGLASYYSDLFHGKPTASGELYDKSKFTAAHKTYPYGTILKVTRLDNNKSVEVRVTDRGPFISGRVVEISRAAAERIGLIEDGGSAKVKIEMAREAVSSQAVVEAVKPVEEKPAAEIVKQEAAKKEERITAKDTKPIITEKSVAPTKKAELSKEEPKAKAIPNQSADKQKTNSKAVLVKGSDFEPYDLFEIALKKPEKKGFGVQVAVLTSQEALFKKIGELQEKWFDSILVSVQKNPKGENLYKVILGPFPTESEATNYKGSLLKNKKMEGFVVDLASMDSKN